MYVFIIALILNTYNTIQYNTLTRTGIPGIQKVFMRQQKNSIFTDKGLPCFAFPFPSLSILFWKEKRCILLFFLIGFICYTFAIMRSCSCCCLMLNERERREWAKKEGRQHYMHQAISIKHPKDDQ